MNNKTYKLTLTLNVTLDKEIAEYYSENPGEASEALVESCKGKFTIELTEEPPDVDWTTTINDDQS